MAMTGDLRDSSLEKSDQEPANPRKWARSILTVLIIRQGFRCYWCDEKIARIRDLRKRGCKIFAIQRGLMRVAYLAPENGQTYYGRLATADHVHPLGKGGSGKGYNVVAACFTCNQDRNMLVKFGAGWSVRGPDQAAKTGRLEGVL